MLLKKSFFIQGGPRWFHSKAHYASDGETSFRDLLNKMQDLLNVPNSRGVSGKDQKMN